MNTRRDFLRKFTVSAMALPLISTYGLTNLESISNLNQGPILRVAIMGLGSYGTRVAEAMQSNKRAKLVGVVSGTPSKVSDWQDRKSVV